MRHRMCPLPQSGNVVMSLATMPPFPNFPCESLLMIVFPSQPPLSFRPLNILSFACHGSSDCFADTGSGFRTGSSELHRATSRRIQRFQLNAELKFIYFVV